MVLPWSDSTWATICDSTMGPKAIGNGKVSSYRVMVTSCTVGRAPVSNASKPSTARARTICRMRSAEIEAEDPVAAPNPGRASDDARLHELIRLAGVVRRADRRERIGGGLADAVDHRVVSDLGALPALVAVHGVVAADHGRDDRGSGVGARGSGLATPEPRSPIPDPLDQLLHEPERRLRRRVAPVEPGVHRDRQGLSVAQPGPGGQGPGQGLPPPVPHQAHEGKRAPPPLPPTAQA